MGVQVRYPTLLSAQLVCSHSAHASILTPSALVLTPRSSHSFAMVNQRLYINPQNVSHLYSSLFVEKADVRYKFKATLELRARLYTPHNQSPQPVYVLTRTSASSGRYALVDSLFEAHRFQPYTHDIFVSVKHGRATTMFRVFFKRSNRLSNNPNSGIRGDLVIMRVAKNARNSVVNMRGASDNRLADYVLKR